MYFSSLIFLFLYLPLVLACYYAIGRRFRNVFLLLVNLIFYGWGEPVFILIMAISVIVNYGCGLLIEKYRDNERLAKTFVVLSVVISLGLLGIFKYTNFLTGLLRQIPFLSMLPRTNIALPIGISFYTFQAMSYTIDVYRGDTKAQKSLVDFGTYVSFFPQLIAGPIVKYHDVELEINNRRQSLEETGKGVRCFIAGLSKKVLIANTMGLVADNLFGAAASQITAPGAWLGALSYMLQIYFDFSGYSDMALGLGMMFGFHFRENFNYPYVSGSIKEFWRRWHMSLSGWFKEYLYIPLGGNRKGKFRTVINKMIVFLCTGIWHGASFNFLFWGAYHGFFLMLEEYVPFIGKKGGKVKSVFQHIYALLTVCIGFVFFRADTMKQGCFWIREMFTDFSWKTSAMSLTLQQLTPVYFITLAAALVAAVPVNQVLKKYKWYNGFTYVLSLAGFCLCILSLAGGTYNPFIYFRF